MNPRWRGAGGFTLLEVLIATMIIGIVAAALMPMVTDYASQAQLAPFRDSTQERWGYKRPDGSVAITPYYIGAGQFHEGRAPVEDDDGFAIIDELGTVVERIAVDAVVAAAEPVPGPALSGFQAPASNATCASCVDQGPLSVERYQTHKRRSFSSAVVLRLRFGVVVLEEIGYEGFRRRVILPGVGAGQVLQWRRTLYPDAPVKQGCSESWTTGTVRGGAFIEQAAGC